MITGAPTTEELLAAAHEAAARAYAPYSSFSVGAAILTTGGRVVSGCNVENASYGLAICAERNAVAAMVASSRDDRTVRQVAVVSPNASPCYPCGACRQVLREFGCAEVVVEQGGSPRMYAFSELLPYSFGPADLGR